MATRALLAELLDAWQAQGGTPVAMTSIGGVDAAKRVAAGEQVDVVVLAQASMARVLPHLPEDLRDKFLTSPRLGMERVKTALASQS